MRSARSPTVFTASISRVSNVIEYFFSTSMRISIILKESHPGTSPAEVRPVTCKSWRSNTLRTMAVNACRMFSMCMRRRYAARCEGVGSFIVNDEILAQRQRLRTQPRPTGEAGLIRGALRFPVQAVYVPDHRVGGVEFNSAVAVAGVLRLNEQEKIIAVSPHRGAQLLELRRGQ